MQVLFITPTYHPEVGGVSRVVREVARHLARKGHGCSVFTLHRHRVRFSDSMDENVKVFSARKERRRGIAGLSANFPFLFRRFEEPVNAADIVHVHGFHSLLGFEAIPLVCGKPMVFTAHHGLGHSAYSDIMLRVYRPIGKLIFDRADLTVFVSDFERAVVHRRFGPPRREIVIPHGVESIRFLNGNVKLIGNREVRLLYVGLLREYKGVQHIIDAMRVLIDKYHASPTLEVIGGGPYGTQLRELANRLHLADSISWLGERAAEEIASAYSRADILVHLSRTEGYGLVVAEALASGTPCIVGRATALGEFTTTPGCFAVENVGDPYEVARCVWGMMGGEVRVGPVDNRKVRTWREVANDHENSYYRILRIRGHAGG